MMSDDTYNIGNVVQQRSILVLRESVVGRDVGERRGVGWIVLALLGVTEVGDIRVGPLRSESSELLDASKSKLGGSSVTATSTSALIRVRGAIQDLLLTQSGQLSSEDGVGAFNGLSSG